MRLRFIIAAPLLTIAAVLMSCGSSSDAAPAWEARWSSVVAELLTDPAFADSAAFLCTSEERIVDGLGRQVALQGGGPRPVLLEDVLTENGLRQSDDLLDRSIELFAAEVDRHCG